MFSFWNICSLVKVGECTCWPQQADKMPSSFHKLFSTEKEVERYFSLLSLGADVNVNDFRIPDSAFWWVHNKLLLVVWGGGGEPRKKARFSGCTNCIKQNVQQRIFLNSNDLNLIGMSFKVYFVIDSLRYCYFSVLNSSSLDLWINNMNPVVKLGELCPFKFNWYQKMLFTSKKSNVTFQSQKLKDANTMR